MTDKDPAGVTDEIVQMLDDAKIRTCFKCHRAIAYEGDGCPVCELIERSGVLARHIKTLEREIEELRERKMKNIKFWREKTQ